MGAPRLQLLVRPFDATEQPRLFLGGRLRDAITRLRLQSSLLCQNPVSLEALRAIRTHEVTGLKVSNVFSLTLSAELWSRIERDGSGPKQMTEKSHCESQWYCDPDAGANSRREEAAYNTDRDNGREHWYDVSQASVQNKAVASAAHRGDPSVQCRKLAPSKGARPTMRTWFHTHLPVFVIESA